MSIDVIEKDLCEICDSTLVPWQRFAGKTVLVSGANGMLPSYIVRSLLKLNEGLLGHAPVHVIALCRSRERALNTFAKHIGQPCFSLLIQDVNRPVEVDRPLHFVIHAASQASPKYYGVDPSGTIDPNVVGTRNLLDLARRTDNEGFLFISSSEVYGTMPDSNEGIREDQFGSLDPMRVRSCYAESKRLGECLCAAWHHQYGLPVTVARPFHTYSPSMQLDDGRVYADFVANIVRSQDIVMHSDGSSRRAFCYITDACIAFFVILLRGNSGQAYNVGNPHQETSMLKLAQILVGLLPKRNLKVVANVAIETSYMPSEVDRNLPDIKKMNNLGWSPIISIEEGFKRVLDHFNDIL